METYVIYGQSVSIFGEAAGVNDKFNRAANLLKRYEKIDTNLKAVISNNKPESASFKASLATLLLLHTGIRVGNEDSAAGYQTQPHPNAKDQTSKYVRTYGLTTLQNKHFILQPDGSYLLSFVGKKCVNNEFIVKDKVVCTAISELLLSNNPTHSLGISDYELTKYIKANIGESFSPKDFRCLEANILAWKFVSTINPIFMTKKHLKPQLSLLFNYVSSKLNNLPGTAKKNYVSPLIIPYLTNLFN